MRCGPQLGLAWLLTVVGCGQSFVAGAGGTGGASATSGSPGAGGASSSAATNASSSASSSSGSGGSSQGGAGGSVPSPPCTPGNVDQLVDDFEDGAIDANLWSLWVEPTATFAEVAGELRFDYAAALGGAWLTSAQNHDLRGCAVSIEVREMMTVADSGDFYFSAKRSNSDELLFYVWDDRVWFSIEVAGVKNEVEMPFDANAHRYWRIREDAGTVFLETSSDGISFVEQRSGPTPPFVDDVEILIGGETWASVAAPGRVRLDNVNILP